MSLDHSQSVTSLQGRRVSAVGIVAALRLGCTRVFRPASIYAFWMSYYSPG